MMINIMPIKNIALTTRSGDSSHKSIHGIDASLMRYASDSFDRWTWREVGSHTAMILNIESHSSLQDVSRIKRNVFWTRKLQGKCKIICKKFRRTLQRRSMECETREKIKAETSGKEIETNPWSIKNACFLLLIFIILYQRYVKI